MDQNSERNFTLYAHLKGRNLSFVVVPFYRYDKRVFRIVSDKIPELVLRLNDLDTWEAAEPIPAQYQQLVTELGEKLDNYLLDHPGLGKL